jgi:TetR/AcrR family transcriptional repressor of nem operon
VARPKAFEPDDVLERAMLVFWRKGYERTSVQDLVDYTGINRFSLYNAFGDKREIFRAACQRYRTEVLSRRLEALEGTAEGMGAIRRFFADVVNLLAGANGARGCLMTNCMVEATTEDGDAMRAGRQYLARMDAAFQVALERARALGEIAPGCDVGGRARYLTTTVQGLTVVGRVVRDRRVLRGIVRTALGAVG